MKNREIDWSYLWLQQFDEFWIFSARNDQKRKLCEFSETYMKKFVKSLQFNLIFGGFGTFGTAVNRDRVDRGDASFNLHSVKIS